MKNYHSIPHWNKGPFGEKVISQDKIDGSSMRFECNRKSGFYKFGTRNVMIDENDENFGSGISIFLNKYSEDLQRIVFRKYPRVISFVSFAEFFGPNSFAGQHLSSDIKDVCLFDISLYKKGIINPYEFQDTFGSLDIPKVIYEGEYNIEFINDIRNNIYNLSEGVVAKGIHKNEIFMTKIKTNDWLKKVKIKMGDKALLDELNGDRILHNQVI
jgi:hypothetical protein